MIPGIWRRIRGAAGWALVAVVVFLAWPAQLGGHLSLVVVSGHSMDGTYRSGDLLLAWPHADYDIGEIIVYKIPKGEPASGLRVVHRVIEKKDGHFTSQGDNRTTPDFWRPTVNDVVGHPFLRIRAGGLALKWLLSPIALALVCGVCVYWAVVGKDDEQADDAEDTDEGDESEASDRGRRRERVRRRGCARAGASPASLVSLGAREPRSTTRQAPRPGCRTGCRRRVGDPAGQRPLSHRLHRLERRPARHRRPGGARDRRSLHHAVGAAVARRGAGHRPPVRCGPRDARRQGRRTSSGFRGPRRQRRRCTRRSPRSTALPSSSG